jgi:hypothetical protein
MKVNILASVRDGNEFIRNTESVEENIAMFESPATNHEWLKILVAAVAGLLTGLISEPLKAEMQWHANVRKVERAILADLLGLDANWADQLHGPVAQGFWEALELPAYEYYWIKNREVFYANPYIQLLRKRCELILKIKKGVAENTVDPWAAGEAFDKLMNEVKEEDKKMLWTPKFKKNKTATRDPSKNDH